jgi:hypothetical protein
MAASHWIPYAMCQHIICHLNVRSDQSPPRWMCHVTYMVVPSCATCHPYSGDTCHPIDIILCHADIIFDFDFFPDPS